jgi:hypothetical protein
MDGQMDRERVSQIGRYLLSYVTEAVACLSQYHSHHRNVKQGNHQRQHLWRSSPSGRCGLKNKEIVSYFPEIYHTTQLKYKNDKYIINLIMREEI